jgi:hypothetical protein
MSLLDDAHLLEKAGAPLLRAAKPTLEAAYVAAKRLFSDTEIAGPVAEAVTCAENKGIIEALGDDLRVVEANLRLAGKIPPETVSARFLPEVRILPARAAAGVDSFVGVIGGFGATKHDPVIADELRETYLEHRFRFNE